MVNSWADILFIHFVGRFQVTCTRMMKKKGIILIEDLYSNRFSTVETGPAKCEKKYFIL